MARLYRLAATANAWVLILVLIAAFAVQLLTGEPPCPLCTLQRIGLMLCALGPIYLLIGQRNGDVTARTIATAAGISILAGLVGAAASARQVLLHILPNDPGYGAPVLGLHLYTWCLIAFLAHIAANAIMLIGTVWFNDGLIERWRPVAAATATALAVVVVANIGSVIAEAGFHWLLPENPTGYLLFGR
ncbi:MAG: disulfide bond formation protein B [Rhodopseudomonas sp.]|nr:disulfide bond formation protein B [Rhodopseudomonas sp.]